MRQILSENDILCKGGCDFEKMPLLKPLKPFSDIVCGFLNELSVNIMKSAEAKNYPDVITFGFFCRKSNIERLKNSYRGKLEGRIARGVSFHIAPSNVPVNFAYSMISALLAGNSCIIRASSKPFRQIDLICECIKSSLSHEPYLYLSDYITVVRYPRSEEINNYFSSLSDIRVIWGGDNTVSEIRKSPLPPRAVEITFADRYSIAVINAGGYLADQDKKRTARDFYNDTYLYDQNACSSPRLIYWLGDTDSISAAKKEFWSYLHDILLLKYELKPVVAVDKYMASCRLAISRNAKLIKAEDNLINRIEVNSLFEDIYDFRCVGGSFIEYSDTTLDALVGIVTRKYQTLSYFGIDKDYIVRFIREKGLCGIDRVVPVGKTADFSLIWDGYDLILTMTRIISSC